MNSRSRSSPSMLRLVVRNTALACFFALAVCSARAAQRFEFTRMIAHWSGYGHSNYLAFVDEAKPEVAQVGFYGAHFWSLADTTFASGYPANLPVRGLRECGDWFAHL